MMTRLFVGNLSFDTTQGDLREAFAVYGPVRSADIATDRSDGKSKGFGFVEMPSQAHADAAIEGLDGSQLKGRRINVSRANLRTDRGSPGGAPRGWAVVGAGRNRW
jgi:RNA recognition motif-containing protein